MNAAHENEQTPVRTAGVDAHDTREGLVLYAHRDDSVHQLNAMSTLLYELSDGRPMDSIVRSFAVVFELDAESASALVRTGFEQLRELGLIE